MATCKPLHSSTTAALAPPSLKEMCDRARAIGYKSFCYYQNFGRINFFLSIDFLHDYVIRRWNTWLVSLEQNQDRNEIVSDIDNFFATYICNWEGFAFESDVSTRNRNIWRRQAIQDLFDNLNLNDELLQLQTWAELNQRPAINLWIEPSSSTSQVDYGMKPLEKPFPCD